MPELDYAILADHVRAEGGLGYVIAGGIDRVILASVPSGLQAGLLMRFSLTAAERNRPHRVELIFQDEDGVRLVQLNTVVEPGDAAKAVVALNFGLPIPRYGWYSLEVVINDSSKKSIALEAVPSGT